MSNFRCDKKQKGENPSKDHTFRKSINFINSDRFRNTIAFDYNPSIISCDTISNYNHFRNSLDLNIGRNFISQISYKKKTQNNSSFYKLKNTLSELQSKLSKANKQLSKRRNVFDDFDEDQSQSQDLSIEQMVESPIELKLMSTKTFPSVSASMPYISRIKTYYIDELAKGISGQNKQAYQHLSISLKVIKSLSNFEPLTVIEIQSKKVCLSREKDDKRKTLVIDIDETIIHCEEEPSQPHDLVLPIKLQNGQYANAYISIRPYAISFLKKMSKHFEIVAFTASHKSYADVVLNEIDPDKEFIKHRLYRHHCFEIHPNIYTKDLRIINRDLSQMVLVDNAPYSYIFQLENGIPILPFYKGEDYQLPKLEKYLQKISQCKDVRQLNKQTFKFHQYGDFIGPQDLAKDLYFEKK